MNLDEAIEHCYRTSRCADLAPGCAQEHVQLAGWLEDLRKFRSLGQQLFDILDTVEANDDGKEFQPTLIHSCRAAHATKLAQILPLLKTLAYKEARNGK